MSTLTTESATATRRGVADLHRNADFYGATDARDGVDPDDGPPPGHDRLAADAEDVRAGVRAHQTVEAGRSGDASMKARRRRSDIGDIGDNTGDRIRWDLLTDTRRRILLALRLAWPFLALGLLFAIETDLVMGAFAEVLDTKPKLTTAAGGAALLVTIGVVLAGHIRARADRIADTTTDPGTYARAAATVNAMQATILVGGAVAILARIRAATLGGNDVDLWGLSTYIAFQAILVLLSIHLPHHAIDNRREIAADLLGHGIKAADDAVATAEQNDAQIEQEHRAQHERIDAGLRAALRHETLEIARLHSSYAVGAAWRRWLDAIIPAPEMPPGADPMAYPAAGSEPDPVAAAGSADPPPDDEPVPGPTAQGSNPPNPSGDTRNWAPTNGSGLNGTTTDGSGANATSTAMTSNGPDGGQLLDLTEEPAPGPYATPEDLLADLLNTDDR